MPARSSTDTPQEDWPTDATLCRGEQSYLQLAGALISLVVGAFLLFLATRPPSNSCMTLIGISFCVWECQAIVLGLICLIIIVAEVSEARMMSKHRKRN